MRFLKKMLICLYSFLGVFTVAVLVIFLFTGTEPTALIGCVFGVTGIESMLSAIIKASERKKEKEDTEIGTDI